MENDNLQNPKMLIQKARNGDNEAFGRLYELYFVPIFRYVYFRVKSKNEAEDLTQEVFLKIYQSIENFEDKNKPPLAYFFTIARNTIVDYWRKKKELSIDENELSEEIPDKNPSPTELVEKGQIGEIVKQSLKDLTEEQQEIIILKFINERTNREIADLLNKSEEAVRQLQCRALKALRQKFKDSKIF
jgi:RNA polymerase sigma-70 factor (ECF subfamily)